MIRWSSLGYTEGFISKGNMMVGMRKVAALKGEKRWKH